MISKRPLFLNVCKLRDSKPIGLDAAREAHLLSHGSPCEI